MAYGQIKTSIFSSFLQAMCVFDWYFALILLVTFRCNPKHNFKSIICCFKPEANCFYGNWLFTSIALSFCCIVAGIAKQLSRIGELSIAIKVMPFAFCWMCYLVPVWRLSSYSWALYEATVTLLVQCLHSKVLQS